MKKQTLGRIGSSLLLASLLSLMVAPAFAGERTHPPMTPELAAKREMIRKQHKQRVTHEQRKSSAETLKAERIKIYNAKHGITPVTPEIK